MDDEELGLVIADVDCALEVEVEEDVVITLIVDVDDELRIFVSLTDPVVVLTAAVAVARLFDDSSTLVIFPLSESPPVLLLGDSAPTEDAKTFELPAAVIVCRLEVEATVVELP